MIRIGYELQVMHVEPLRLERVGCSEFVRAEHHSLDVTLNTAFRALAHCWINMTSLRLIDRKEGDYGV